MASSAPPRTRLVRTAPLPLRPPAGRGLSAPPGHVLGQLALAALAALVVFELATWDKITPGVAALGIPIGGISQAEAITRLQPGVEQTLDRPLTIHGADQTWQTTPRQLGLRLDATEVATAAYQVGREGNPAQRLAAQLGALVRGVTVSATSTTDASTLESSLSGMASQIQRQPQDAQLTIASDGTVQSSPAADGLAVDLDASREQLTNALDSGAHDVELVTRPLPPAVPDSQLQAAHDQLNHLLGPGAQPLVASYGQQTWQLAPSDVVKLVSLDGGQAGQPTSVKIDDTQLKAWVANVAKDIDQPVQEPRFHFSNGTLQVLRPSKTGRSLDQDATVQAIHAALLSGSSSIDLPVSEVQPSVSSDNPAALGITEQIGSSSTSFSGSVPEKIHNIQLAADRLNGIVVAPGATFSFNDGVGPTTIDAGFQWGFGITSGNDGPRTVPSVAGGICQVATTLFQSVFWSGYQVEQRFWHMYWIPSYTSHGVVGLDATVDEDSGLDLKWTNTTNDYVLIQSASDNSNVYFALYGKKPSWTVKVDDATITNRTSPNTTPLAQPEPSLPWGRTVLVETARDGFDVEIKRHVIPSDGSKERLLDLKSHYEPAQTITLVGTGGAPAGANVNAAIERVLAAQDKPAPAAAAAANPTAAPKPQTASTPAATTSSGAAAATPAQAHPTAQPTAAAKPAATAEPPKPTATPNQPKPTPKPTTAAAH